MAIRVLPVVVVFFAVACGVNSRDLASSDGGSDASSAGSGSSSPSTSAAGGGSLAPAVFSGNGACATLGAGCASASDCCSGQCTAASCSYPSCASDQQPCASSGDCCSQSCSAGVCVPLNATCSTLGNACASASDCCSGFCPNGTCQPSSFCGQPGDACSGAADCCTGVCNVAAGAALGTCASAPPGGAANCGLTDGMLCAGSAADGGVVTVEGGLPACGGACCSRACAPWGPTGVLVCQPASGCHIVGDLCTTDSDCCGATGLPGGSQKPVTCDITAPATVGVCRLPMGCKPDGDVCKLQTMSCNSSCDCCAGNCETEDTCKQDNVGVPRCAGACVGAGHACASSANCCNGLPCVPNSAAGDGGAPYVCYASQCVASCGPCTTTADCCPGSSCIEAPGSARGTCGPCEPAGGFDGGGGPLDGGPPPADGGGPPAADASAQCAQFGQLCQGDADCCDALSCNQGRCGVVFVP